MSLNEFEVLKASHRFLRGDGQAPASWEDEVADKYESTLFREFAVCDLKHYKSGQFALRWRTEDEVVSGAGQETCGNTRCDHHPPERARKQPSLSTLELPFNYVEHGEQLSALVKVVLCDKCVHKLMWKRNHDKQERLRQLQPTTTDEPNQEAAARPRRDQSSRRASSRERRSASPRRKHHDDPRRKRRSRSRERLRDESSKEKPSRHRHNHLSEADKTSA